MNRIIKIKGQNTCDMVKIVRLRRLEENRTTETVKSAADLRAIKWNKLRADETETNPGKQAALFSQLWRWLEEPCAEQTVLINHMIFTGSDIITDQRITSLYLTLPRNLHAAVHPYEPLQHTHLVQLVDFHYVHVRLMIFLFRDPNQTAYMIWFKIIIFLCVLLFDLFYFPTILHY